MLKMGSLIALLVPGPGRDALYASCQGFPDNRTDSVILEKPALLVLVPVGVGQTHAPACS